MSTFGKVSQQAISTTAEQSRLVFDNHRAWWVFDDVLPELNAEPTTVFRVDDKCVY